METLHGQLLVGQPVYLFYGAVVLRVHFQEVSYFVFHLKRLK